MKDLKCGLKNCEYNKGYCCCARQITVDSNTDCATFTLDENKAKALFEAGADFAKCNYSVDTKVLCAAKCIFNREGTCVANGITVMGQGKNEAACLTFIHD